MLYFRKILPTPLKSYVKDLIVFAVKSLPNIFRNFSTPAGIQSYKEFNYLPIYPSSLTEMPIPKTIDEVNPRFIKNSKMSSTEAVVLSLEGGVSTSYGANLTKYGVLIEELSKQLYLKERNIKNHRIFDSRVLRFEKYNSSIATLSTDGQRGYYHWMFNVLPKIHLLEKSGLKFDKIYVDVSQKFQEESIRMLGYNREQIIEVDEHKAVSGTQLIVPSLPDYIQVANTPTWTCNFLRQKFLNHNLQESDSTESRNKRIYISRATATSRKIINELEVVQLLQSYGFSVVELEKMSFSAQVNLFKNAEAVVAPHGAGLSNLVFCTEKTKVIEIFSPRYIVFCYWFISRNIGLDYYCLFGEGETLNYYEWRFNKDNIYVNLDKLKRTFDLAGISPKGKLLVE